MTVPRYTQLRMGAFRRIRTASSFRPSFLRNGSAHCGTAIAVPYRKVMYQSIIPQKEKIQPIEKMCLTSGGVRVMMMS